MSTSIRTWLDAVHLNLSFNLELGQEELLVPKPAMVTARGIHQALSVDEDTV